MQSVIGPNRNVNYKAYGGSRLSLERLWLYVYVLCWYHTDTTRDMWCGQEPRMYVEFCNGVSPYRLYE